VRYEGNTDEYKIRYGVWLLHNKTRLKHYFINKTTVPTSYTFQNNLFLKKHAAPQKPSLTRSWPEVILREWFAKRTGKNTAATSK